MATPKGKDGAATAQPAPTSVSIVRPSAAKAGDRQASAAAAAPPAPEDKKAAKAREDAEFEAEWQRILDYYEPASVEKREEERLRRELEAKKKVEDSEKERNEVLEEFYGIKPKSPAPDGSEDDYRSLAQEKEEWNFPEDKLKWTEADLGEEWADAPPDAKAPFYDPYLPLDVEDDDDDDEDEVDQKRRRKGAKKAGRKVPQLPHSMDRYVPYRKGLPPLPEWPDVAPEELPYAVLEEMAMEEEFLQWASYIFRDGSTYEGTVWNDLAQGRGVYTTPSELCKYEGEWVQNRMEGHGVVTVDVPKPMPVPDSEAWNKLKAEGRLYEEANMSAYDKEWLKMDLEDLAAQAREAKKEDPANATVEDPTEAVPFEDHPGWVKIFGQKPEKGHYQYAGQMKQNKFHGCGVFTLNGKMHFGKFYFGDFLFNNEECDAHTSAMHAGLAQVAAAKARMFVNKPDGMVREVKGPYTDLSHPYMYDEEDMWQAPGFINEFFQVPKVWEKYVEDVDAERGMWLNSFYKAPLRLPMPAELSYMWEKPQEFVLLRNEPRLEGPITEEDVAMADPSLRGEVLLHVPTQQIINWAEDPQGRLRFFVQPFSKDGKIDPEQIRVLPLGFEEFLGEKEASLDEDEEVEEEEEEDASDDVKTVAELRADLERKQARAKEKRERKLEEEKRRIAAKWNAREKELEEKWAREDEEEAELRRLEEEQMEREEELVEEMFEAKLMAALADDDAVVAEDETKAVEDKKAKDGEEKEEAAAVASSASTTADSGAAAADAQGEASPAPPAPKRKAAEEESPKAGGSDGGDGPQEPEEEEEEEEEEDDEEDKKPRSFGTVASAASLLGGATHNPHSAPSAFASITLSSQAAMEGLRHAATQLLRKKTLKAAAAARAVPTTAPAAPARNVPAADVPVHVPAVGERVRVVAEGRMNPCHHAACIGMGMAQRTTMQRGAPVRPVQKRALKGAAAAGAAVSVLRSCRKQASDPILSVLCLGFPLMH